MVVAGDELVGEGFHAAAGAPHAEVEALRQAGSRAVGATLYVTLEPCNHFGRTPPCTEAVIAAGIARVVACHADPDPRVSGSGLARLRAAGIQVEVGLLAEQAALLNLHFLIAKRLGRPGVSLKWAMSLDGKIATAGGESRWISSPRARRWALALREEHDALLVGIGTVLADDPRGNRRLGFAGRPNLRVVLDRRLRLPADAKLLADEGPVVVYTEAEPSAGWEALERAGAQVVRLARVGPAAVLADLAAHGTQSVLVEGGGEVASAFVAAGCYDRVLAVVAPKLVGGREAPTPLGGPGLGPLAEAPALENLTVGRLGEDFLLTGHRNGCLRDLLPSAGG